MCMYFPGERDRATVPGVFYAYVQILIDKTGNWLRVGIRYVDDIFCPGYATALSARFRDQFVSTVNTRIYFIANCNILEFEKIMRIAKALKLIGLENLRIVWTFG